MSRNTLNRLAPMLACIVMLTLVLGPAAALAGPSGTSAAPPHSAEQFLVKFRPGTPAATVRAINAANRVSQKTAIERIDVRVLTVPPGKTAEEMVARYAKNPNVEFAEVDALAQATLAPNDPLYPRQWAHPYVNTPAAWDLTIGSSSIVVAVLDTGLDTTHPEMAGRVVAGYDYINNDADPSDDNGHGTRAAGIALATGNNGAGVAGMDWNARVMPVKVLDSTGYGSWSAVAQGLTFAADNGARVINMSLGGPASSTLQSAIKYAYGKGCVIAAASGNENSGTPIYPAGYSEVIAVGSVFQDVRSYFSNYGPHLDVVAPGESIDTIAMGGTYGRFTGTSAATPFVAGLAGLMLGAAPDKTPAQVMAAITSTARDLGATGWDQHYGWGHIDAAAAIAAVGGGTPPDETPQEPTPPAEPEPPADEPPADTTPPAVWIVSPADGAAVSGLVAVKAEASDASGVKQVSFYANGTLIGTSQSAPYQVNWNTKKLKGTYVLTVVAHDTNGNAAESASVTVTIADAIKVPPPKR